MALILFLDRHLWLYYSACGALLAATGWLAFLPLAHPRPTLHSKWGSPLLFFLTLAASLFALRHPIFFYPTYIGIDEAQMLAQAITYRVHHIPWVDVDGGSGGPLDSYVLLWCVPFGIDPTYLTSRIFGLLCVAGMLLFLYITGRRLAGEALARLAILPVFLFFAFTSMFDWVHYTSEHLPLLLLGGGLFLLCELRRRPDSMLLSLALGLVLGLLPFAKLQTVLLGGFLGGTAIVVLATRRSPGLAASARRLLPLLIGAAAPAAVILYIVARAGGFDDFWQSYIQMAQVYSTDGQVSSVTLPRFRVAVLTILNRGLTSTFPVYLTGTFFLFAALRLFKKERAISPPLFQKAAFATLFFLIALATVLFSSKPFFHYLLYLMIALPPLLAVALRVLTRGFASPGSIAARPLLRETRAFLWITVGMIAFLLLPVSHPKGPTPSNPYVDAHPALPYVIIPLTGLAALLWLESRSMARALRLGAPCQVEDGWKRRGRTLFISLYLLPAIALACYPNAYLGHIEEFLDRPMPSIDQAILHFLPPGGRLVVWGSQPNYAAETKSVIGVRSPVVSYEVFPSRLQGYFRARFLRDMRANRPELFVEAAGPDNFFADGRFRQGIACFPGLAALIAEDYRLVEELDGMRLYLRRDLTPPPSP